MNLLSGSALFLALSSFSLLAQSAPPQQGQPSPVQAAADSAEDSASYTLKVTTREVGVEVVALDDHQHPVHDLTQNDFQVFEVTSPSPQIISSFQAIDSAAPAQDPQAAFGGYPGTSISTCATRATLRYRLSFHPSAQASTSGYHQLRVTTTRPHVTLYYRQKYFVGATSAPTGAAQKTDQEIAHQLQGACASLSAPSSIALIAKSAPSAPGDPLHYTLIAPADALSFAALPNGDQQIHLNFGICEYNSVGLLQGFFHTSNQQTLSSAQYQHALAEGIASRMSIPSRGAAALLRFVALDAGNGNLGTIDVPLALPATQGAPRQAEIPAIASQNLAGPAAQGGPPIEQSENIGSHGSLEFQDPGIRFGRQQRDTPMTIPADIGSFGSPLPLRDSMCGDVYSIPPVPEKNAFLPDFWNLNPLGEVHPYSLNVGEELLNHGIPGIVNYGEWFGIDYYGKFWIAQPGKYGFQLYSDDGARLFIDDQQLINIDGDHLPISGKKDVVLAAGSHTLHLPYFQAQGVAALVLLVRTPGDKHYKVFDVRDFSAPTLQSSNSSH